MAEQNTDNNQLEEMDEMDEIDECHRYYCNLQDDLNCYHKSRIHSVLMENKFTDVTFIVGPNKVEFGAVRALMATISPVFEAMLFGVMKESALNSEIVIEDIEENGFRSVINFAYMQDPAITTINLPSVYQICDKYQIEKLSELCETLFYRIIKPQNLCLLLSNALYFKCHKLIDLCKENLSKFGITPLSMLESNAFLEMSVNAMILILQCDALNIIEDDLWEYVSKWIKHQNRNEKSRESSYDACDDHLSNDLFKKIFPFIRFGAMSSKYFIENVKPLNILTDKEVIQILTRQIMGYPNPRNTYPKGYLPLKYCVFGEDSDDSDYDSENEEDKELFEHDQVEDEYCQMDQDEVES